MSKIWRSYVIVVPKAMCLISVILSCLLITSCQTTAQRQGAAIRNGLQIAKQRADDCFQKIDGNPLYQNINQRLPSDPNQATPMQMADESIPTDEDVQIMISRNNESALCRGQFIEDHMQVVPSIIPFMTEYYYSCDLVAVDLIQRKTSWGEANKRRRGLAVKLQSQLRQAFGAIDQKLAVSHKAEIAQRQAAFDALQRWNEQQLALQQRNSQQYMQNVLQYMQNSRTVITNCVRMGDTVRCTSN